MARRYISSGISTGSFNGRAESSVNKDEIYLILHHSPRFISWRLQSIQAARIQFEPCICNSKTFFLTELYHSVTPPVPCSKAMRSYYVPEETISYLSIEISHNYVNFMFFCQLQLFFNSAIELLNFLICPICCCIMFRSFGFALSLSKTVQSEYGTNSTTCFINFFDIAKATPFL